MPRRKRKNLGNIVYHVLNRANGRLRILKKAGDFDATVQFKLTGEESRQIDIFAYGHQAGNLLKALPKSIYTAFHNNVPKSGSAA